MGSSLPPKQVHQDALAQDWAHVPIPREAALFGRLARAGDQVAVLLADMLERWVHHYNWHRPHQGIEGIAPMSRLKQSGNNLLTLHT